MKTETQNTDTGINIVKVDSCPSLTGKSTLTYHIGCNADEIQIRVHANTGGGYFSKEWIAFSVIQETLAKQTKPFSSMLLKPLFNGKSSNTPAFLLAALKHLGVIKDSEEKGYECGDIAQFVAEIESLNVPETPAKKAKTHQRS